jgi:hypothetical protein
MMMQLTRIKIFIHIKNLIHFQDKYIHFRIILPHYFDYMYYLKKIKYVNKNFNNITSLKSLSHILKNKSIIIIVVFFNKSFG